MVDEERVTRLANGVLSDVARLSALAATDDLIHKPDQLDAVKYRFVTAIEGCVSIAHHVTASEGWTAPDTNAAAMRGLADHGVIDGKLAEAVTPASGFRNLLVHQYGTVDDGAVVGFLDRLDDLERFVRQVLTWMAGQDDGSRE